MRRRLEQVVIIAHKIFPFITFYHPTLLQLFWPPFYRRVIFINIDCMSSRRGHYATDPPSCLYSRLSNTHQGGRWTSIKGLPMPGRTTLCARELLKSHCDECCGKRNDIHDSAHIQMLTIPSCLEFGHRHGLIMMIVTKLIIMAISCDMLNPGRRSITAAEQGSAGQEKG